MNRFLFVAGLVVLSASAVWADEPAAVPKEKRTPVALATAGIADGALVARVRDWASLNTAIAMPLWEPLADEVLSMNGLADKVRTMLKPESMGVVVIAGNLAAEETAHGAFYPADRTVVVNLRALNPEGTAPDVLEKRIERQVIRGIAFLMGLEPSPNPFSAMTHYSTLEELDQMGRNLDPPWLIKLQEKAVEWGIELDTEGPYYMLR